MLLIPPLLIFLFRPVQVFLFVGFAVAALHPFSVSTHDAVFLGFKGRSLLLFLNFVLAFAPPANTFAFTRPMSLVVLAYRHRLAFLRFLVSLPKEDFCQGSPLSSYFHFFLYTPLRRVAIIFSTCLFVSLRNPLLMCQISSSPTEFRPLPLAF